MIIFKCRFTGDEMLTDAFEPKPVKDEKGEEVPGLFQIQSQRINKVRPFLVNCIRYRKKRYISFFVADTNRFMFHLSIGTYHIITLTHETGHILIVSTFL